MLYKAKIIKTNIRYFEGYQPWILVAMGGQVWAQQRSEGSHRFLVHLQCLYLEGCPNEFVILPVFVKYS